MKALYLFIINILGVVLNYIYNIIGNYGFAIIIFSILLKVFTLPMTISQKKGSLRSSELSNKSQELQRKYKNNPQKYQEELVKLYRETKVNPLSSLLFFILSIYIIICMYGLVQNPLTYMRKVEQTKIETYKNKLNEENENNKRNIFQEIEIIKEYGNQDNDVNVNMKFLDLDLTMIPAKNLNKEKALSFENIKILILPVLYILLAILNTFISTKDLEKMSNQNKKETKSGEEDFSSAMQQASKNMIYITPILIFSLTMNSPLGLALYWLVSAILTLVERYIINYVMKNDPEMKKYMENFEKRHKEQVVEIKKVEEEKLEAQKDNNNEIVELKEDSDLENTKKGNSKKNNKSKKK